MATFDELMEEKRQKKKPDVELFESWQSDPKPEKLRAVVEHFQPIINRTVQYYIPKPSQVVLQRARLLAAKAVRSYDPKYGASLKTHINNHLQALQRMVPQIQDPLSPPERFRMTQREIAVAADIMSDQLGRDPTDEELAEQLKLPADRVTAVRKRMRSRIPTSVYEESGEDDGERPDIVGSSRDPYDDWIDAVYHDLGPVDRLILMHRTGYRGAEVLSTNDIAKRVRLTASAVSQRAHRIQEKLDQFYGATR